MLARPRTLTTIVVLAALRLTPAVLADYIEVDIVPIPASTVSTPDGYRTWRAVALFTDAHDSVQAVGAGSGTPLAFETDDPEGLLNLPDDDFGTGLPAEDLACAPLCVAWDSYVTIGATQHFPNDTQITDGFLGGTWIANVIKGTSFSADTGGWFDADPGDTEEAGDDLEIVIAQFTVRTGFRVELCGVVYGRTASGETFDAAFCAVGAPCLGDLDGTGDVGFGDLVVLLAAWGQAGSEADLDDDGLVDLADLLLLLSKWGDC
jgi:hypothetical protein